MIQLGIVGYGNLGRGVECAVHSSPDMTLAAVFTRRDPKSVVLASEVPVYALTDLASFKGRLDVLVLCGGSATDLPVQTPALSRDFCVVDSFDNHGRIPDHFAAVDAAASKSGTTALLSCGWDPGLFSMNRALLDAVLPVGQTYTFWGRGISQGHSDAIRRIKDVEDARAVTVPISDALGRVREGKTPALSTRDKHTRECFVVAAPGADKERISREIKTMPNYFADYDTTVHFVDRETLAREHGGMPHAGAVIRSGTTGQNNQFGDVLEFNLRLESNPHFTAAVLVACARACNRLSREGRSGAFTMLDFPLAYLSPKDGATLRKELL